MMESSPSLAALAWVAVIGFFILGTLKSGKNAERQRTKDAEAAAAAAHLRQQEDFEELEALRRAESLLPDAEAALGQATKLFRWPAILSCAGLSSLEMHLLFDCQDGRQIRLPNLLRDSYGPDELRVARRANHSSPDAGYSLIELAQEPTAANLGTLVSAGLVTSNPPVDNSTKDYEVAVTERGLRLLELNAKFASSLAQSAPPFYPRTAAARSALRNLVFGALKVPRS